MLKLIISDESDLPSEEAIRNLYKEQSDGSYLLEVDGAVPKKKLDEFRKTNVALKKKLEKFDGIDPDEAKEAIERKEEFDAADGDGAATAEKIREAAERIANERVEKMKQTHEKQLDNLKTENGGLKRSLEDRVIGDALRKAGTAQGLRAEAVDDLIARGRSVFKVDSDGNLISLESDGETPKLNDKGDAFGANDFVGGLVKSAPHLFGDSKGSDSRGSGSGGGSDANGPNPWAKDTFNLTKQGEMIKDDPQKAKRLAAKVGKVIHV